MNKELNQKFNYLLLGDEKYTECPHILTITTEEKGISLTEDCGDLKELKISYEEILDNILSDEQGKEIVAEIIKRLVWKKR